MNERNNRARRRRPLHKTILLAGVAAAGLLLMGAGKAVSGETLAVIHPEAPHITEAAEATVVREALLNWTEPAQPSADDWKLMLVNPWNPIPKDYSVSLTPLINGQSVDERCYPDLQEMMDDCRAAGLSPLICSSYRTQETQQMLFDNKVSRLMAQGYSQAEATVEAGKVVAVPGTSEHQLGLALDIVDINNQNLDESQEKTAVQQWLMENSWKYGFILRYPDDKSDITGIIYEPWHYRYVGKEAAEEIYEQGICLEEYLDQLSAN